MTLFSLAVDEATMRRYMACKVSLSWNAALTAASSSQQTRDP